MNGLMDKCKKAYKAWKEWDSYELGRKGEMYFNTKKMEFGLIQHTDRTSKGYIGENEFWIPIVSIIDEIEDVACRSAKVDEVVTKIEKYVTCELERRGLRLA